MPSRVYGTGGGDFLVTWLFLGLLTLIFIGLLCCGVRSYGQSSGVLSKTPDGYFWWDGPVKLAQKQNQYDRIGDPLAPDSDYKTLKLSSPEGEYRTLRLRSQK